MNAYQRVNSVCLAVLAVATVTAGLIYAQGILVPFVISFFFYVIASPGVDWLQKRFKLSRGLSILVGVFVVSLVLALVMGMLTTSINSFVAEANKYEAKFVQAADWATVEAEKYGVELNAGEVRQAVSGIPIFSYLKSMTGGLVSFVGKAFLVFVFVLFLLVGHNRAGSRPEIVQELHNRVSRYVATKVFTSFLTACCVGIVLGFVGVELAFMFSILAFLLNFIPSVGSIFATFLPIPVLLLQFGLAWQFTVVLVLTGAIQLTIGNVVEPKMMGQTMDLHPVTILFFLMFWGFIWGVAGMFLAVPITAIVKIILERFEPTQPLANILAGRAYSAG